MANEIQLSVALAAAKGGIEEALKLLNAVFSMTGTRMKSETVSVGTSEEAIPLGECGSAGWFMAWNHDAANFVELRVATGGTKFAKMRAGEPCIFRWGSGISAPFWIADTGACLVEYLLIED